MSFTPTDPRLCCADCGCEVTLEQYRRKLPRCDDCEADHLVATLEQDLAGRSGTQQP